MKHSDTNHEPEESELVNNMPENCKSEKRDIANSTDLYPIIISNPIFKNLHELLLKEITGFMRKQSDDRTLLILGLSPVASPYADNKEAVLEILGASGKIITLDYNMKVIISALKYMHRNTLFSVLNPLIYLDSYKEIDEILESLGAIAKRNLILVSRENIDPSLMDAKTFLCYKKNLNHGLNISRNSVDCIDATLTLHHVSPYRQQLKKILEELYATLKPGGMLFYGDVFVDMRASEAKINKIMNEFTSVIGKDTMMLDDRDSEWKAYALYRFGEEYSKTPKISHQKPDVKCPLIKITNEGTIVLPIIGDKTKYVDKLNLLGYFSKQIFADRIEIPLIDPAVERHHVRNVSEFQDLVKNLKIDFFCTTNFNGEDIEKAISRGLEEKENALKGLFEYMSSKEFLVKLLEEVGFEGVKAIIPDGNKIYPVDVGAIVAFKPKAIIDHSTHGS